MFSYRERLLKEPYYHLFNRGVDKREVFLDDSDYQRAYDTLFFYTAENILKRFSLSSLEEKDFLKSSRDKLVSIISFCFMPNHFHVQVKEEKVSGLSTFISRFSNSYTRYFNLKYKRGGYLFQGKYKKTTIQTDEQLLHVSRYIHLNPLIGNLVSKLEEYRWFSYPEFLSLRKGFCEKEIILSHFSSIQDYINFIADQANYARSLKMLNTSEV